MTGEQFDRARVARLATAVVYAVIGYVAIDVALAFIRRDYSLLANAESDYGRGRDAWLMDLNFELRAVLSLAAAGVLAKVPGRPRWPLWLVGVWAVASALLGLFADNPPGYPRHHSGSVHLAAAAIAFTAIVIATTALSISWPDPSAGLGSRLVLRSLSVIGIVSYLVLPRALNRTHGVGGLIERIFLASQLLWILVAMIAARKAASRAEQPLDRERAGSERGDGQDRNSAL